MIYRMRQMLADRANGTDGADGADGTNKTNGADRADGANGTNGRVVVGGGRGKKKATDEGSFRFDLL